MCRLLGIASSEPTHFRIVFKEAPRSLATLSREHPDGWGVAIYESLSDRSGISNFALLTVGVIFLGALVSVQKFLLQRMHRILNPGVLAATFSVSSNVSAVC